MSKFSDNFRKTLFKPVGIALVYLLFSTLWIIYSDRILENVIGTGNAYAMFQTYKGLFFVLSTTIILFFFVRKGQRQLQKIADNADELRSRYRQLVDNSPYIYAVYRDDRLIFVNKAAVEKFEAGDESKMLGKSIKLFLHPEYWEDARRRAQEMMNGAKFDHPIEEKFITVNGREFPVEVRVQLITLEGEPAVQVVAEDISERLRREIILEQMVKEKNVLLSEIHHRVKNNMAIISALMQLQSYETGNEEVAEILDKSISRIKSIALIHENLYEVQNLSEIELARNVRDLVQQISRRYSKESDVWFSYNLEEIKLNINQAVSVGLFLNEVISELFRASTFSITREVFIATHQENGKITLSISENLNKRMMSRHRMFEDRGFLIDLMAQQLDGDLVINQSKTGFEVQLSFSKDKQKKGSAANKLLVMQ